MIQYILNPINGKLTTEGILNLLLDFIKIGKSYKTLNGKKTHEIIKIEGEIKVKRHEAEDEPEITFEEFTNVINLFKNGKSYNTSSKELRKQLKTPTNTTPLMSILLASGIIEKEKDDII